MSLSFLEQETVIIWNREEDTATVNTYEPSLIRKLDALCETDRNVVRIQSGDKWAVYRIPKKWAKVQKPRTLSEEKLEELRARGKAWAEKMNGGKNNAE